MIFATWPSLAIKFASVGEKIHTVVDRP